MPTPSRIVARLDAIRWVLNQLSHSLTSGETFTWGQTEAEHNTAYAAGLGLTLVTKTGLKKLGYRLKRGAMPVGKRYYGAPLSHYADLYVLECQAVRIPKPKKGD